MTDSIRSATVRLEAQVAGYIADMKAAGKVTDEAFRSSSVSAKRLDRDISGVSTRAQELGKHASTLQSDLHGARTEADRLATSVQRVGTSSTRTSAAQTRLSQDVERTERSMRSGGKGLDSYTDRLGLLVSTIGAVGPALIPLGVAGVGGLAGLANDAGAAAVAGGSLIVAFHGVGKALAAVNKAAIDPTAANLAAAKLQMDQLAPAARHFVTELHSLMPLLEQIQQSAASGWFPGLTEALHELRPLAPVIGKIFHDVGQMGGDLLAKGAASLAGDRWRPFFEFIDQQAPKAMAAMAKVVGSLTHGLAGLWMAFSPVSTSFNQWLVDAAHSFDTWASGLSKTQGFQDFVAYLQQNGPRVGAALGAIATALVQIVQAAAPLGGPTLDAITGIAKALGAIANSPLGTPILAIVQLASALRLLKAATSGFGSARGGLTDLPLIGTRLQAALPSMARFRAGATQIKTSLVEIGQAYSKAGVTAGHVSASLNGSYRNLRTGIRGAAIEAAKAAAPIAAVAVASSGVADKFGLSNTASLALAGSLAGPWGTAIGAGVGLVMDFASASSNAATSLQAMNAAAKSSDLSQVNQQLAAAQQAQADFMKHTDSSGNFFKDWANSYGDALYQGTHGGAVAAGGYQAQITALSLRSEELTKSQLGVSDSFVRTAHAAGMTTAALAQLTAQTNATKDAALGAFGAENSYRDSLAAAEKQAKSNSAGIKGMSANARANSDALASLAGAWNQNLDAMQANGASLKMMRARSSEARAAFIQTATAMGVPTKAAQTLADKLLHIPPKVNTNVTLTGAQAAMTQLDRLRALISGNPITQSIIVRRVGQPAGPNLSPGDKGFPGAYLGANKHGADGTSVPKDGRAYGDRYLYMLAPGEEVISNRHGQADRFRADRAAGRIPGYADGGTVGRYSTSTVVTRANQTDPGWKNLREHLKATTKELENEKNARTALVDKMHQLSSSVQDGLRTDLFTATDPWSSRYGGTSPAGVMGTLRGDNANIRAEIAAIKALKNKGVTGDALAAILAQGGLEGAKAFAALSAKDLAAYERLFNQRAHLLSTVGSLAGSAAYGSRVSAETKEIRTLTQEVRNIQAQLHHAEHQRHKDAQNHTNSQKRGVSSAGRKNARSGP